MGATRVATNQIKDGTIGNADIASGAAIDPTKIADGSVNATEFQFLDGATSNLQAQINALSTGIKWKPSVRVATVSAGTLASSFENGDTIDGVVLATGDRILIKDQAAPAENGIYVVAASGAPSRATDADSWTELVAATVMVEAGTVNADRGFTCTSDAGGTLGSTAVTFVASLNSFSIGGSTTQVQFNLAGAFTGSAEFTWDDSGKVLQLGSAAVKGLIALRHQGGVRFYESNTNGSNYIEMTGPASLASNYSYILPSSQPSGNPVGNGKYVLVATESSGIVTLAWYAVPTQYFTDRLYDAPFTGSINGSNNTFVVENQILTDSEVVFLGGIRQKRGAGNDYTVTPSTGEIVFEAGNIPQTGDNLVIDYMPNGTIA